MTRKEQIWRAAIICPTVQIADDFYKGAEWADKHPKEGLWNKEKVIEWIEDNLYDYIYINRFAGNVADWNTDLIKDLTKAMEE